MTRTTNAARVILWGLTLPAFLIPGLRARYSRKGL